MLLHLFLPDHLTYWKKIFSIYWSINNKGKRIEKIVKDGNLLALIYFSKIDDYLFKNKEYFLIHAAGSGHLPIIEYLVEHNNYIHADYNSALRSATEKGHLPVVKFLVEHGAKLEY